MSMDDERGVNHNTDFNDDDIQSEESEEDVEPKLTYERISNDIANVFKRDTANCIAVHSKFIALGTRNGKIYIFDHQGNRERELSLHNNRAVKQISIDDRGEYIASCCDERVAIYCLYSSEHNFHSISRVSAVSIDPYFSKPGNGKRFVACNDDKVILYEKKLISQNTTLLQKGRGQLHNIRWKGQFVVWSSDLCIKIYDMMDKTVITVIDRDKDGDLRFRYNFHQCSFCWKNERTLLIGWYDSIKICSIKDRIGNDITNAPQMKDPPKRYVEITSTFNIDYLISGIAPMELSIVALCLSKDILNSDGTSSQPLLQVIETIGVDGFEEISSDILSPKHYADYHSGDYHLECLPEEGLYFIVCPKDVIVAKPREEDDHVKWLLDHGQYVEALEVVKHNRNVRAYTLLDVGWKYLKYLLEQNHHSQYELAARSCATIFGSNIPAWEKGISEFAAIQQLRVLAPYLPRGPQLVLDKSSYEMVLHEFLKYDSKGFLNIIRELPKSLYNISTIIKSTINCLSSDSNNKDLLEALAELYSLNGEHELSLTIYLEIGNKKQVFDLIRHYGLYSALQEKLELLMQLNADETARLLLENQEKIPIETVITKLKGKSKLLCSYLDLFVHKDPELCAPYHGILVELYAQYSPTKLLGFLRSSNHYSLEKALEICRKKNLFSEVVFLLGRMGNTKEALHYITDSLDDINHAIEFCKEHNDAELWEDLIKYSLEKPCFIRVLLQNIGTHMADPISLIKRIPKGVEIEGLKQALVNILQEYNLQISLEEGCKRVLVSDCYVLLEKLCKHQRRGVTIADDSLCHGCQRKVFAREIRYANDIVIFNCCHVFHEDCLPTTNEKSVCAICINRNKSEFLYS